MLLKLKRVSQLPNKFGTFAYLIVEGNTEGLAGIYPSPDGKSKVLFSFVRTGELNRPFSQNNEPRTVGDKKYFQVIDPEVEGTGKWLNTANLLKRQGVNTDIVDTALTNKVFGDNTPMQRPSQQLTVEQPAEVPTTTTTTTVVDEPQAGAVVEQEEEVEEEG